MARHRGARAASLIGWAGVVLTVIASGAILPGSAAIFAPNAMAVDAPMAVGAPTAGPTLNPDPPSAAPVTPEPKADAPTLTTTATTTETTESPAEPAIAQIAPSPVTHLTVPAIGVDAHVLPVDSHPTGKKNAWGGDIFSTIEFPVDADARQWVRRGDPNSLPAAESEGDPKAFDRVVLYGHASDIGHHLVFQDLSALKPGDSVIASTALGVFTYRITLVATNAKYDLNNFAPLYDYPTSGAKEIALVACLPDTTSNVVVIGTLAAAKPVGVSATHSGEPGSAS